MATISELASIGCPYCSTPFSKVFHGGACPKVKEIEYYPNGTIKKIVFRDGSYEEYTYPDYKFWG